MTIPLTLYIHFPWCLSKCPYCDFNSHVLSDEKAITAYVDSLLADLEVEARTYNGSELSSVYFGGGTPSLLSANMVTKIIQQISKSFTFKPAIEITLEANPGTIDLKRCEEFRHAGINRISLGIQSFDDEKLKAIKRIHDAKQALAAIDVVKSAGFTNFNLDLMFGLPGQSVADGLKDLQAALNFTPPHLSWYQLTIEPNTLFAAVKPSRLPHSEKLWKIQQAGQDFLSKMGLKQYEVAAFCRSAENTCRHNINYWQYGDYLGIGAGAHSKITAINHSVKRYWKTADPRVYTQSEDFIEGEEIVATGKIPLEFMFNALRLYQPLSYGLFQERTGFTIDSIKTQLQSAQELGLIELADDSIVTTKHGKNFLNDLLEIFL